MTRFRHHALCTFGDGPDVLLVLENTEAYPITILRGHSSVGLNEAEARSLAADLLAAAERARELKEAG